MQDKNIITDNDPGPKLYIIATPIGNRNDITLRAIDVMSSLASFLAEDTRETRKIFEMHNISLHGKQFFSYGKHNLKEMTSRAIALLQQGESVGLLSDRGSPCISDPGAVLVAEARARKFMVIPIPGPSSVIAAMSVCGFQADQFVFLGFLPRQQNERKDMLLRATKLGVAICFFEAPHRITNTMRELEILFPNTRIFVAREMTKAFEEYRSFLLGSGDTHDLCTKGEFVLVLEPVVRKTTDGQDDDEISQAIELRLSSDREWAKFVARQHQQSPHDIYNALQRRKRYLS